MCSPCDRPTSVCLCDTFPKPPVQLLRCHVLILLHPLERKRKNSTLPLIRRCLDAESLDVIVGRRLLDSQSLPPNTILVFPGDNALSLFEVAPGSTLLFLDATWDHAKEMVRTLPKDLPRVSLKISELGPLFVPRRFDIRTPPTEECLSTGECIAWAVDAMEGAQGALAATLLRPLDRMVSIWHTARSLREEGEANVTLTTHAQGAIL